MRCSDRLDDLAGKHSSVVRIPLNKGTLVFISGTWKAQKSTSETSHGPSFCTSEQSSSYENLPATSCAHSPSCKEAVYPDIEVTFQGQASDLKTEEPPRSATPELNPPESIEVLDRPTCLWLDNFLNRQTRLKTGSPQQGAAVRRT